jgi:chaperonin GroEL (HSP60 family)
MFRYVEELMLWCGVVWCAVLCCGVQVAGRTNDSAGDGTTTASVLAREMIHFGLMAVTSGANPIAVKKGIDKTQEYLVGKLKENAKPVQGRNDIRVSVLGWRGGGGGEVGGRGGEGGRVSAIGARGGGVFAEHSPLKVASSSMKQDIANVGCVTLAQSA